MKVGIIGFGHVGKSVYSLFTDAKIYDKYLNIGSKEEINDCDVAFISVPTPTIENVGCDTSIVEESIKWCQAKVLIIRSTVRVGFTDEMKEKYHKRIIFQPEYYGETKNHPFKKETDIPWVTLGGSKEDVDFVKPLYESFNIKVNVSTAKEAEMAKYMCNLFLATKVTFANEMYDICEKLNIEYDHVKELFLEDPRMGKSHLDVYPSNRGFGGSCFPKDTKALYQQALKLGYDPKLLKSVIEVNEEFRKRNKN